MHTRLPSWIQTLPPLSFLFLLAFSIPVQANPFENQEGPPLQRREINIQSGKVQLQGTLVYPASRSLHPVVVVTHGSEAANRKVPYYQDLARMFATNGIAALIYDKRGVGQSTGKYVEAPDLEVPARDVVAWVHALKRESMIDGSRIGVWGISQGGWVGPLAASLSPDIKFVISVSGPGVSPLEQNLFDKGNQLRAEGFPEEVVKEVTRVRRLAWTYMRDGKGYQEALKAWDEASKNEWFEKIQWNPPLIERSIALRHPRLEHFAAHSLHEPVPVLEALKIPVLAIFGDADTIVPVKESVARFKQAFQTSGNPGLTIKVFAGADHGIRVRTESGSREFASGYWEATLTWAKEVVRR